MAIDGAGGRPAPTASGITPLAHTGLRWLLIAGAIGWPVAGLVAPAILAWALLVLGAAVALAVRPRFSLRLNPGWPVTALLTALLAWGLASALWSIQPEASAWRAAKLAALLLAAWLAFAAPRPSIGRVGPALAVGLALAVALILFEVSTDMAAAKAMRGAIGATEPKFLFYYNRGATVLALAVWPAVAGLMGTGRRWMAIICVAAASAGVFLLDSDAARIGIVAGLVIFGLTLLRRAAAGLLLMASMAVWIAAAPFVAAQLDPVMVQRLLPNVQASHLHRILIWKFVGARALERPVMGWGLGASRALPEGTVNLQDTVDALPLGPGADQLKEKFRKAKFEQLPLHPHSAVLQIWLELGAVGAALLVAMIASAIVAGRRRYAGADLASFQGLLLTFLVIANFSYGAWQSWWLAALALALVLLQAGTRPSGPSAT